MQEPQGVESKREYVRAKLDKWGRTRDFLAERSDQQQVYDDLVLSIRSRSLTSKLSDMPHGTNVGNPTENAAMAVIRLEDVFVKAIDELRIECEAAIKEKHDMDMLVERLPREQKTVLCMLYRDRGDRAPTWDKIGEVMGYSEQRVRAFELEAVDALTDLINL